MNRAIKVAFKITFCKSIWNICIGILTIISSICTILGITLYDFEPAWLIITCFLSFIVFVIILCYRFIHRLSVIIDRKDKEINKQITQIGELTTKISQYRDYFSFMYTLTESFAAINKIVRSGKINETNLQKEMLLFCTNLKKAFERLNVDGQNKHYSVSIKVVTTEVEISNGKNLNNIEIVNSFRDIDSFRDSTRNEAIYSHTKHLISQNTAYKSIINLALSNNKQVYYINNNVSADPNYETSSRTCYLHGKIPYESELVVPIYPLNSYKETSLLLGFLCVTSDKTDGFILNSEEIEFMLSIADGLYNLFSKWQKNQIEKN